MTKEGNVLTQMDIPPNRHKETRNSMLMLDIGLAEETPPILKLLVAWKKLWI